ncbi:hypothetical protein H0H93_001284 [Arthromyces matolae]|nr:hypothetical protein H0H93_001284 [Arthromyces matolae]
MLQNAIASYTFFAVSVVVFALSLGVGIVIIKQNLTLNQMILHQSSSTFQSIVWAWLVTQVVLEAGLAGTVGFSLKTCKPQFMPPSENSTLVRVIRGSIQSGTLVFVFSLANLIAAGAGRTTTVFLMFSLPIAPLYSLIIFDTLLARRVSLASPEINSMPGNDPSGIWIPTIPKAGISGSGQNQAISLRSIQVRTEVYTDGRHIESTAQFDSGSDDADADQKVGNVV